MRPYWPGTGALFCWRGSERQPGLGERLVWCLLANSEARGSPTYWAAAPVLRGPWPAVLVPPARFVTGPSNYGTGQGDPGGAQQRRRIRCRQRPSCRAGVRTCIAAPCSVGRCELPPIEVARGGDTATASAVCYRTGVRGGRGQGLVLCLVNDRPRLRRGPRSRFRQVRGAEGLTQIGRGLNGIRGSARRKIDSLVYFVSCWSPWAPEWVPMTYGYGRSVAMAKEFVAGISVKGDGEIDFDAIVAAIRKHTAEADARRQAAGGGQGPEGAPIAGDGVPETGSSL